MSQCCTRRTALPPNSLFKSLLAVSAAAGGEFATAAERERLAARLAALPTSEAEDQALLDGGTVTGEDTSSALSL